MTIDYSQEIKKRMRIIREIAGDRPQMEELEELVRLIEWPYFPFSSSPSVDDILRTPEDLTQIEQAEEHLRELIEMLDDLIDDLKNDCMN